MGDRFRMVLRRKPGSTTSSVRTRRLVVPPKKDDLSVLTWKEQQMIEKAQLASLKTSSQKKVYKKRGRPRKNRIPSRRNDQESSSTSDDEAANDADTSDCFSPPPPLSPLTVITSSSQQSKAGREGKRGRPRKRCISSRRSPSGQSFGSMSSFPELLSPCVPVVTSSGGFAARKSAYTGAVDSDDEDDEYATRHRSPLPRCDFQGDKESSDEDNRPCGSSPRKLRTESMPTTEDFISYLVLKGINCVPDELKYIGNLQWETIVLKRKNNNYAMKKSNDPIPSEPVTAPSVATPVKPKQIWAKKVIEKAKKSLTVKRNEKQLAQVAMKPLRSRSKRLSSTSSSGCAKMIPAARPLSPIAYKKAKKQSRNVPKQLVEIRNSKTRGGSTRMKSPASKRKSSYR